MSEFKIDTDGITNDLICIEYPGLVKNVDNALKTLGGIREVSKVIAVPQRRLELRFRPDDYYCKPACGDRYQTNSLLLRVRVRIRKSKKTNEILGSEGLVEIVGRCTTAFKFRGLCDFQYLPVDISDEGKVTNMFEEALPKSFSGEGIPNWLSKDMPYFLIPPVFARVDSISSAPYMFRKSKDDSNDFQVIGRTRKRKLGLTLFVSFNVKNVPTKPKERALKIADIKVGDEAIQTVKKCFEKRPIWSKLALICDTKLQHEVLKHVLPTLAYYFISGPFRGLWVKIGYDPRTDPSSMKYQTLDYRLRNYTGLTNQVKPRSTSYNFLPNKLSHTPAKNVTISKGELEKGEESTSKGKTIQGDEYIFTPTSVPHSRQMYYQYIDLKVPEIEAMFERLPKNTRTVCDPQTGWLPRGFESHCRDVLTSILVNRMKKDESKGNDNNEGDSDTKPFNLTYNTDDDDEDADPNWEEEEVPDDDSDLSDFD